MEKDFLNGLLDILHHIFAKFTAPVQQPERTEAAVQPTPMTSRKWPREALADVDGNVEIPPKQVRKKWAKKQATVSPEPTGDILAKTEFEEQNTTIMKKCVMI